MIAAPAIENSKLLSKKKFFDYNLEALRGLAALFVVLGHAIQYHNYLEPSYLPSFMGYFPFPGHFSVLIFFVLSGYVIGLTNKEPLQGKKIRIYLKKRLVRLYPIYSLALIFTLLVATQTYSLGTIIANLTFTQVLLSDVIWENNPIWTLHYEVIYYLLFIPISFFRIKPLVVITASLLIGVANYFLYPTYGIPLISSYAFGFVFWAFGLLIAQSFTKKEKTTNYTRLLSTLFLVISLYSFNVLSSLINKICVQIFEHTIEFPDTVSFYEKAIPFTDMAFLPYGIMCVLLFTGKEFKFKNQLFWILQLLPALTFVFILKNPDSFDLFKAMGMYYLISTFLFFYKAAWLNKISKKIINKIIDLGMVSYGIYIIHFPILFAFSLTTFFTGSLLTFVVRFVSFVLITLLASYLLERKLQPLINKTIKKK